MITVTITKDRICYQRNRCYLDKIFKPWGTFFYFAFVQL